MKVSIIIPTLNESQGIGRLIERLLTADRKKIEIIIVDGGSTDDTLTIATKYGVKIIRCSCSRAIQMNTGVKVAKFEIIYFVHADTLPPIGYLNDCENYLRKGFAAVCYKSKFEGNHFFLKLNAYFSQFYWLVSRGGDQSLFIKKSVFIEMGMYNEEMVIMEEYPIIEQLLQSKRIAIAPKAILISTRKYANRSWLKVSRANYAAFKLYQKGERSEIIKKRYLDLLGE